MTGGDHGAVGHPAPSLVVVDDLNDGGGGPVGFGARESGEGAPQSKSSLIRTSRRFPHPPNLRYSEGQTFRRHVAPATQSPAATAVAVPPTSPASAGPASRRWTQRAPACVAAPVCLCWWWEMGVTSKSTSTWGAQQKDPFLFFLLPPRHPPSVEKNNKRGRL